MVSDDSIPFILKPFKMQFYLSCVFQFVFWNGLTAYRQVKSKYLQHLINSYIKNTTLCKCIGLGTDKLKTYPLVSNRVLLNKWHVYNISTVLLNKVHWRPIVKLEMYFSKSTHHLTWVLELNSLLGQPWAIVLVRVFYLYFDSHHTH